VRLLCVGNRYPPWSIGGYEAAWSGAVAALRAAGHRVRVLTTTPDPTDLAPSAPAPADVHRELQWYWRAHAFPSLGLRACVTLERSNAAVFARHLREFRPDAIMWWSMGGMSLSLLEHARRAGIPALGVVCDDWFIYGRDVDRWTGRWRGPARAAAGLAEKVAGVPARVDFDRVARWAFISRHTLNAARAAGWQLPGAAIAHAGVDSDLFQWREPGPWRWRLLYSGRIDPRKGVATAIEALPALGEATLTIDGFGDAEYLAELSRLADRLGVAERIRFAASSRAELCDVYASADAVLFPVTWQEPWGLVPLEAMTVGRPVIASRAAGGAGEYLVEETNCLQFDAGDPAGLAAAVHRVAADTELRSSLRTAGRETAARFTAAHFHSRLEHELAATVAAAALP
jgi:glycogen synthase